MRIHIRARSHSVDSAENNARDDSVLQLELYERGFRDETEVPRCLRSEKSLFREE